MHKRETHYARVVADVIVIVLALSASGFLMEKSLSVPVYFSKDYFLVLISCFLVWWFSSKHTRLYDEFRSRDFSYEVPIILKNVISQIISVIVILFFIKDLVLSRQFVLFYGLLLTTLLLIEKLVIRKLLDLYRARGRNIRTVLIIGAGNVGRSFFNIIDKNPHFGYHVIGFLDDRKPVDLDGRYLGSIGDLEYVLSNRQVDNVIIALPNYATQRIGEVIRVCENYPVQVRAIPDYFRYNINKYSIGMFGKFPIITFREEKIEEFQNRVLKRLFDIFFSLAVILFVMSWLVPIIAVAIKLSGKGPVFFVQERWGMHNRKFKMLKFRTMKTDSRDVDENGNYCQAIENDPRVTAVGKLLRKTSLDELPQFFNVLAGHMSVVGPRPHPTPLNLGSSRKMDGYLVRHRVKPGITGWAQVNGYRGPTKKNPELMKKRLEYDLWYIKNWSLLLDIQIILLTIIKVIKPDPTAC